MDVEEMHIPTIKNLCLVSSASSANFYSSLCEGDFEIDGSLISDSFHSLCQNSETFPQQLIKIK